MRKLVLYIALILLTTVSCVKEIDINIPTTEAKTVIEGIIEQGQYPYVIVTRNSNYFDPVEIASITDYIDTSLLNFLPDSVVLMLNEFTIPDNIDTSATVIVSNGVVTDTLIRTFDLTRLPFIMYKGTKFVGEAGRSYNLKVETGGRVYTANTSIPNPVQLDSVRFKYANNNTTDYGLCWIYFKDPDSLGNYYRGFSKVLGKDSVYTHPYNSVYDDQLVNGQLVEFSVNRGWDPAQGDAYFEDDGTYPWWSYVVGEKVVLKLCSMGAIHYDFWYSVEQQSMSDGNPFASPISVRTNIEGGAIGVWGGYGVSLDTIIIEGNNILLD